MNIKTRLSLHFTLLVAGILLFFSILFYYFAFTNQRNKFRDNLLIKAQNTAILLINVEEVDSTLLKKIHQSTTSLIEEEIAITDSSYRTIWSNETEYLTESVIKTHGSNENYSFFEIQEKEGIQYKHLYNNQVYYVYVMAFDSNRDDYLSEIQGIFIWSIIFSLWLSILLSYLFSKIAIQPLSQIIKKIKTINSAKLSDRLIVGNKKDEIGQLSMTFNEMLDNLEIAFKNQEEFVSNASHEFRTPLAVIIAEADYLLNRECSKEVYIKYIEETVSDLKNLNVLLYSLLELAHSNSNNIIQLSAVRIDEIIFSAVHQLKIKHQDRKIVTKILYPEDVNELLVNGNSGLLEIVFKNLIDNACKFSTNEIIIEISILDNFIVISFEDKGIGIPSAEIDNIFKPFNRATNVSLKAGFGIGLYMVWTIINLHSAKIKVYSDENEGTRFELTFDKFRLV